MLFAVDHLGSRTCWIYASRRHLVTDNPSCRRLSGDRSRRSKAANTPAPCWPEFNPIEQALAKLKALPRDADTGGHRRPRRSPRRSTPFGRNPRGQKTAAGGIPWPPHSRQSLLLPAPGAALPGLKPLSGSPEDSSPCRHDGNGRARSASLASAAAAPLLLTMPI